MTIKDLEERTGLSRANIRFYEKEGLLSPLRRENGYREYSQEDVQDLLRIKLLRGLRLPLDDIRATKDGMKSMEVVMGTHLRTLQKEQADIAKAETICQSIRQEKVQFGDLDAEGYLEQLKQDTLFIKNDNQTKRDVAPAVPIRRLFARLFDLAMYSSVWLIFLLLKTREYPFWLNLDTNGWTRIAPTSFGSWEEVFAVVCPLLGILTMIILEPLWIRIFRGTPGKFIMGLRFSDPMPILAGLRRTWRMIEYGFGFFIPVYLVYRWWKSYWNISYGEGVKWDDDSSIVEAKQASEWFLAFKMIGGLAVMLGGVYLSLVNGYQSPNQGLLTVSEFEENCSFYDDYYFGDGKPWFLGMSEGTDPYMYPLQYEVEDGVIKAIRMDCEGREYWVDYDPENPYVMPIDAEVIATILLVMQRDYMEADISYSYYPDTRASLFVQDNFQYEANGILLNYEYDTNKGSNLYLQVIE